MTARTRVPFLCFLVVVLTLTSCGGRRRTVVVLADSATLLQGPLHLVSIVGEDTGGEEIEATWGTATADGAGEILLVDLEENDTGFVSVGSPGSLGYAVGADRRFGLTIGIPGVLATQGGITAAGDLAVSAPVLPGLSPGLYFFGRRGGSFNVSSLTGTYFYASYGAAVAPPHQNVVMTGTVTFDGAGSATTDFLVNREGLVMAPFSPPLQYTVDADGTLAFSFTGGPALSGGITAGGQVVVCAGDTNNGGDPWFCVLLRQGADYVDADLDDAYFLMGMAHDVAGNAYRSFTGTMLADSDSGTAQLFMTTKHEDQVSVEEPGGLFTELQADGTLTFALPGGEVLVGGVSADRRFGMVAGSTTPGDDPTLVFFLR